MKKYQLLLSREKDRLMFPLLMSTEYWSPMLHAYIQLEYYMDMVMYVETDEDEVRVLKIESVYPEKYVTWAFQDSIHQRGVDKFYRKISKLCRRMKEYYLVHRYLLYINQHPKLDHYKGFIFLTTRQKLFIMRSLMIARNSFYGIKTTSIKTERKKYYEETNKINANNFYTNIFADKH